MGAQFLFLSRDRGRTWERISSDLTTNDPNKQKQEESGGVTTDNSSAETTVPSLPLRNRLSTVIRSGSEPMMEISR